MIRAGKYLAVFVAVLWWFVLLPGAVLFLLDDIFSLDLRIGFVESLEFGLCIAVVGILQSVYVRDKRGGF